MGAAKVIKFRENESAQILSKQKPNILAYSQLRVRVTRIDGTIEDYGVVSTKAVTSDFCEEIVDELITNNAKFQNFKYHAYGEDNTAASASDTALLDEVGNAGDAPTTRATGTQVEGASANIYKTVGTITAGGTYSIVEHGVFWNGNGGSNGILLDRHTFSTISVDSGDAIEFTYELTFTAGG